MTNLVIFLVGLVIMLALMMKTKLGPFICMLLAGLGIGIACGQQSCIRNQRCLQHRKYLFGFRNA